MNTKKEWIEYFKNTTYIKNKGYSDFVVVFHIMKFSSLKRKIITHCFY